MVIAGGFFVSLNYIVPLIRTSSYFQNSKTVDSDNVLPTQDEPIEKSIEPIKEEDDLLKQAVGEEIGTFPAGEQWSVFAYDLFSDKTISINADHEYDSASLYKLFLLDALEKKLPLDRWQWTYLKNISIKDCVENMLQTDDDPCSEALADFVGWDNIDQVNAKSGFSKTTLAGQSGRKTTAAELGELLIRLKKGHMLSDLARRFVFDVLYQQNYTKGIVGGCSNCRVASKAGELTGVSHDVGVVTHGRHSYIIVIMSEGGSFKQISELTKLIDGRFYQIPSEDR
jgi:beta-lactamase class A